MNPTTALKRALNLARVATFVYLTSTIVVMASERVFWYWAGFTVDSVFALGAFYLIPTASALWVLARAHATRWYHVILAGAVFGFVVEGVLTPMLYIDGPLPIMAAMFVGWHGVLAFFGFWYLAATVAAGEADDACGRRVGRSRGDVGMVGDRGLGPGIRRGDHLPRWQPRDSSHRTVSPSMPSEWVWPSPPRTG